jgi:hypothetical protein
MNATLTKLKTELKYYRGNYSNMGYHFPPGYLTRAHQVLENHIDVQHLILV